MAHRQVRPRTPAASLAGCRKPGRHGTLAQEFRMAPEAFRTPAPRRLSPWLFLCGLLALASPAHALRIVNYNVLNYPGSTGPTRDPFFRTILSPLSPDVFVAEEMTSAAGCTEFLNSLNTMEPGQWANVTFMDGNDTDSELFYKPSKVQFL